MVHGKGKAHHFSPLALRTPGTPSFTASYTWCASAAVLQTSRLHFPAPSTSLQMWCELPTRFIGYTSVMRFSLPWVPLLASSDCDLGTFKYTTEFLSLIFLCNCTMTSGMVTCPWVFTCPFGVTIDWLRLFYWHITHIPTWWSVVTLTFRTNEDNKPCCLQLSYDIPLPQQCSHTLLTICQRIQNNYHAETVSQRSNSEAESVWNFWPHLCLLPHITKTLHPSMF